jgi:hypothetical protein
MPVVRSISGGVRQNRHSDLFATGMCRPFGAVAK